MTPDEYIRSILNRYLVPTGPYSKPEQDATAVGRSIAPWAGSSLKEMFFSGSYAKGTGVSGTTDIDLFISFRADTSSTLSEIFQSLYSLASTSYWQPRKQNVSVGVTYNGTKIDLVPGKVQSGYQNYHSLYRSKKDSWTQTNVALQTATVRDSGRINEIRALKIWRNNHGLDFPSYYLELAVIEALRGRPQAALASNVNVALEYMAAKLGSARIVDPANTNNVVSDDLTAVEKKRIANQATNSRAEQYWERVIW